MKKIKFLGLAALSASAIVGLAACGNNSTPTTTPTSGSPATTTQVEPEPSDKVIKFYNTAGDALGNLIKEAAAGFAKKYPGWTVESQQVGGYDDVYNKVVSDLSAGTTPDIAYCYSDHVALYLTSSAVVDLQSLISSTASVAYHNDKHEYVTTNEKVGYSQAEIDDFVGMYYKEGLAKNTYSDYTKYGYNDNSMLTLPYSKSTEVMYYNASALKRLNLEVPTTWDEMWEACKTIKQYYPNSTPLCYDSEANWFINMCEQNGWDYTSNDADHYKFSNENTIAFLEQLHGYFDKKYIETQTTYGSYTSNLFKLGADSGCIFCIGSSAGASHQDPSGAFNWGVAQIPSSGEGKMKVISQGPSLVMFDNGNQEKIRMTWLFMKELLEPAYQATFSMNSGYNPVRLSSYEIDDYKDFLADAEFDIVAASALISSQLSEANVFYTSPAFKGSAEARVQVGSALVYAIRGQKTAKQALDDAIANLG